MSASPFDIAGLVLGLLGVFGTIDLAQKMVAENLPVSRIMKLEGLLWETQRLYASSMVEGLLSQGFRDHMDAEFEEIGRNVEDLRTQAFNAFTTTEKLLAIVQGLSRKIYQLEGRVGEARAQISIEREKARSLQGFDRRPMPAPPSTTGYHSPLLGYIPAGQAGRRLIETDENLRAAHTILTRRRQYMQNTGTGSAALAPGPVVQAAPSSPVYTDEIVVGRERLQFLLNPPGTTTAASSSIAGSSRMPNQPTHDDTLHRIGDAIVELQSTIESLQRSAASTTPAAPKAGPSSAASAPHRNS